jgi:hypothetical protein
MRSMARNLMLLFIALALRVESRADFIDWLFGKRDIQVITNTQMSTAGQKLPEASKAAPQYYIAVSSGFHDFGGVVGGIKAPPKDRVLKLIAAQLAKRGYLPSTGPSTPASLVIFLTWGTLNADRENFFVDSPTVIRNRSQILAFLGAKQLRFDDSYFSASATPPIVGLTMLDFDARNLYEAASEDFYVIAASAYSPESIARKKPELLWRTRIACFSLGFEFDDVLPAMVSIGGTQFGRETTAPVWESASERFKADVKSGEIELVEYLQDKDKQIPIIDVSTKEFQGKAKAKR